MSLNTRRIKLLQIIVIAFTYVEFVDLCLRWQLIKEYSKVIANNFHGNLWLIAFVSAGFSNLALILFIASVCLILNILYRALSSIDAPDMPTKMPGRYWALLCWFIPVVNLWAPFLVIKKIVLFIENESNTKHISKALLYGWWILWVVVCVIYTLTLFIKMSAKSLDTLQPWLIASAVTQSLAILDCYLYLKVLDWLLHFKERIAIYKVNTETDEPLLRDYYGLLKLRSEGKIQNNSVIVNEKTNTPVTFNEFYKHQSENLFVNRFTNSIIIINSYCAGIILFCVVASKRSWIYESDLSINISAMIHGGIFNMMVTLVTLTMPIIFFILYFTTSRNMRGYMTLMYMALAFFISAMLRGFIM